MAGTGIGKAKSGNLDAKEEEREEGRRSSDRNEEQDLNQGMDTGTHDSTRHGVDWGPSYQVRSTANGKQQKKGESDTASRKPKPLSTSRSRGGNK